jgi:hypothetical protein
MPGESERKAVELVNRMRLFASSEVIEEAESVLKAIIEISLKPAVAFGQLAREALSRRLDPDTFLSFCRVCRSDLDTVRRTMA